MGSCLSKKSTVCSSPSALPEPSVQSRVNPQVAEKRRAEEETLKKEIFVIKHRRSHDIDRRSEEEKSLLDQKISETADVGNGTSSGGFPNGRIAVRTSSCTKEEVDAILIQCGRLSRSSSTRKAAASGSGGSCENEGSSRRGRKYSGSKRSYDFDQETCNSDKDKNGVGFEDGSYGGDDVIDGGDEETVAERIRRHRQRQYRPSSSSSSRRRTPSRERDQPSLQQHRSSSRERGGSGGRRVSRSPGRRSESPIPGAAAPSTTNSSGINPFRPGKMVSVPATVSSLAMDKTNNGTAVDRPSAAAVKRISVKRNAGDPATVCRSAASPRSRSPARANLRASNENQNPHSNQPLSLNHSNSRKAEQSPYRRNPLNEIDQNCMGFEPSLPSNKSSNNIPSQKPNVENVRTNKVTAQGTLENTDWSISYRAKDQMDEDGKGLQPMELESLKPPTITRSRSSRLSRDLEFNPETLPNPSPSSSYTALLLEDVQNFHQKSNAPAISLPPCVTKACSILEAVADLNSSSSSNLPSVVFDDRRKKPALGQFDKKKRFEAKDPLVESEVMVCDDLMEPTFHKYVTLRRGGAAGGGGDVEEQESLGSNSFAGSQQCWVSSSLLEHNSVDSTEPGRRLGEKERESDQQRNGIGRGRVGSGRGLLHLIPPALAAA